ncbi:MAG: ribosomal RNA small subunit methyltransferase A [Abditibacteriota bacterium]|nr:ribosomal RNA small subunit methyltransferase A [Abditibacteriota bacterium]
MSSPETGPRPRPKKSLGQNFLTDKNITEKIAEEVRGCGGDALLEIGSGQGALTGYLAEMGKPLFCVEADRDMTDILEKRFSGRAGVTVICADFLKWDMSVLEGRRVVCAGNLPYYITTPIIKTLLEGKRYFTDCIIMVQKEVADRLTAPCGSREAGAFTLFCRYHAEISRVCKAGRGCFYPVPKVDSCVLHLKLRSVPPVDVPDEELFFNIIRAAFGKRRKTLSNNLKDSVFLWWSAEKVRRVLSLAGIDGSRRGETLSLEEFAMLCRAAHAVGLPGAEDRFSGGIALI